MGVNTITITVQDSERHQVSQTATVTRQPSTTPPMLTVLSPASNTFSTSASSIIVSGTVGDDSGAANITWTASSGSSGMASVTTNWRTAAIPLYLGTTTIVITASDAAGNSSWRSLVVTRN